MYKICSEVYNRTYNVDSDWSLAIESIKTTLPFRTVCSAFSSVKMRLDNAHGITLAQFRASRNTTRSTFETNNANVNHDHTYASTTALVYESDARSHSLETDARSHLLETEECIKFDRNVCDTISSVWRTSMYDLSRRDKSQQSYL